MKKLTYSASTLLLATPFIFSISLGVYALPVVMLVTISLYFVFLRSRVSIYGTFANKMFLLYFAVLVILLPFSVLVARSVVPVLWGLIYLAIFLLLQGIVRSKQMLTAMSGFFVIITTLYCFVPIYVFIGNGLSSYTRLVGMGGNHNIYGGFLIVPFFLSVYLLSRNGPILYRLFWSISSAIISSSIILTFSRGTWLSIVVILLVLPFIFKKFYSLESIKPLIKWFVSLVVFTAIITTGIWFAARQSTVAYNPTQVSNIDVFSNQDSESNAFTARLHYFGDAVMTFSHSPVVGFGLGTYASDLRIYKTDPNFGSFADPHNWLLKMLVEGGIFTTIAFIIFLLSTFWHIWKLIVKKKEISWLSILLFCGLLANALHGLMDFDWSNPLLLLVFFIFTGALYGTVQYGNDSDDEKMMREKGTPRNLSKWIDYVLVIMLIIGSVISIQLLRADLSRANGDYLFYVKGDYDRAINSYFASAAINRFEPTTWFNLWRSYVRIGNFGAAKYCLKKAIDIFPESGLYYTAWAETDEAQNDYTDYRENLLKSIKYFPANSLAPYVKLVNFDYKQKKYDEALFFINQVLPTYKHYQSVLWFKSDPNSPEISKNIILLDEMKSKIEKELLIGSSAK